MLVPSKQHNRVSKYEEPHQAIEVAGGPVNGGPPAELPQRALVGIVWRRRWVVLGLTLLAVIGGFVYVQKATPIFVSSSRIYVEQNGPRILSDGMAPQRQADSYIYAQAQVVQSTPVVSKALETINASRLKTFAKADNPLLLAKKSLKVEVGKKDDLITVSFESPYPQEASDIVNEIVRSYMEGLGVNQKSNSAQVLEILQKEKDKQDKALVDVIERMKKYRAEHDTLALEYDKNNIALQKLSRLSDQLSVAQVEATTARAELAAVEAALKDEKALGNYIASRQVMKDGNSAYSNLDRELSELRSSLHKFEMETAHTERVSGKNHPMVSVRLSGALEHRRKIRELELDYARAFLTQAQRTLEIAEEKVLQIHTMFETARKEASNVSTNALEYALLESEMKRQEQRCEQLEGKVKDLALTAEDAAIGRMKAQILDVARPEDRPAKPKKAMILAAALMMGLMFGCGSALAADWMDQRLRSIEEVRVTLGYPVLGIVPHMKAGRGAVACGQAVALEPMSETAEAYRTIRTAVYFGSPDGDAKKLMVTSPSPGDGKSTTASNLAIAMAKAGQRVVLLDCDFRRPTQHKVFELEAQVGLSSVVSGQARVEQAVCHSPLAEGLDILPCGPIPPNPAELLNSQAFADLLDRLAETYDHVIIDAPPVLAVADARIVAAICDQAILVLRAEKSTRNMALAARDGLLSVGGQLLGVVVNDVPKAKKQDGYYYSYGTYRYGYYGQGQMPAAGQAANGRVLTGTVTGGANGDS
jgi:capsular exopolysaccharide synthesis family protein